MPTYEYQCPEGHEFEKFQKMTDKPRAKCPVCGKMAVRKISGGAGLVFKGTGFYITDYGKDGKGPRKEPARTRSRQLRQQVRLDRLVRQGNEGSRPPRAVPPSRALELQEKQGRRRVSDALRAELARGWPRGSAPTGSSSCSSVRAMPATAISPPTWRWCSRARSAATRARRPNACSTSSHLSADRGRPDRDRRPRLHQFLARARSARLGPAAASWTRAPTTAASVGRGPARSTSSSSRPTRPARCTSATAAAPRWATRSPRCSNGPGHTVTREFYINDAGVQIDRLAQSLWARVQQEVGREGDDSRGRLSRRVPAGERAGRCLRGRDAGSPTSPPRKAFGAAGRWRS